MSAMEDPDFATLLRRYRRHSGMTQEELAERAGLSLASVSLLERGVTQAPQKATVTLLSVALARPPAHAGERGGVSSEGAQAVPHAAAPPPATPRGAAIRGQPLHAANAIARSRARAGGAVGAAGTRDNTLAHADWPCRRRQDAP